MITRISRWLQAFRLIRRDATTLPHEPLVRLGQGDHVRDYYPEEETS